MGEDLFVSEGKQVGKRVREVSGKRVIVVPSEWDREFVMLYPAEVKYKIKGKGKKSKIIKKRGKQVAYIPESIIDDHVLVVKIRRLNVNGDSNGK